MTYLITFSCYGHHLHGEAAESVDRRHNTFGNPRVSESRTWETHEKRLMDQPLYVLDEPRRNTVLAALREVCKFRSWYLFAAHVRTSHVHAVIEADDPPEQILAALKAYASRRLNEAGLDGPDRKRWARHGSTKYIFTTRDVAPAIRYVVDEQGVPMAVFEEPAP